MRFRLITIAYGFALVAAGMSELGPWLGVVFAGIVGKYWYDADKTGSFRPRNSMVVVCIVALLSGLVLLFLFPAFNASRNATPRLACQHNAINLVLAMMAYRDAHGAFPSSAEFTGDSAYPCSWRVALLPHWGESDDFAASYNRNEPWDSPANLRFAKSTSVFGSTGLQCPAYQYHGVHGDAEDAHWFQVELPTEGGNSKSNELVLIEATEMGVPWTEPRDVSFDQAVELLTTSNDAGHLQIFDSHFTVSRPDTPMRHVVFLGPQDYQIRYVGQFDDPADARAMLRSGSNDEDFARLASRQRPQGWRTEIKWPRVYGAVMLAGVTLAPAIPLWRRRRARQLAAGG
ncbi:MAG: DUF1559 domain-containing protein [Planctomycetales bacterium]|nr:DUF1559 domain-containing protein [Planctomycetales bacterium]